MRGRIRTTSTPDIYGKGYEKEVTIGNDKYRIRTTSSPDIYGDGYEKEIKHVGTIDKTQIFELRISVWIALFAIGVILSIIFNFKRINGEINAVIPPVCFIAGIICYIIACIKDYKDKYSVGILWTTPFIAIFGLLIIDLFLMFIMWIGDFYIAFPISRFFINVIKWIFVGA